MADDDLTPTESAILIVLMAEAREISGPDLKTIYGFEFRKENREKLNTLRYVASRQPKRTYLHQLDDRGWVRLQDDLNFESPRARALGGALTAVHHHLRDRVLPAVSLKNFAEMFARAGVAPAVPVVSNLELRIRNAYTALANEPRDWVSLRRLRPFFGDIPVDEFDGALRSLELSPDVNIAPESNQKTLTAQERAAAVHIGGQEKHLLAIGL